MIDLHTHTLYSDGVLIPAESARFAKHAGYTAMAYTDHADASNMEMLITNISRVAKEYSAYAGIDLFAGVELTQVPPALIAESTQRARDLGAEIVVMHGETLVEPVERGVNLAAIEARVDILAHPGLITDQECALAAEKGVYLEITSRKGHSLTNGHVAAMARKHGASLVVNNDAHSPGDWISREMRRAVALGAGLSEEEYAVAEANSQRIVQAMLQRARSRKA